MGHEDVRLGTRESFAYSLKTSGFLKTSANQQPPETDKAIGLFVASGERKDLSLILLIDFFRVYLFRCKCNFLKVIFFIPFFERN